MAKTAATKTINLFLACAFAVSSVGANAHAAVIPYGLPEPGRMFGVSAAYSLPVLKGVRLDPQNPLQIEFLIDSGSQDAVSQEDGARLVRYFLAGLTIPEDDIWVNLSPLEKDRIVPEETSRTDIGKDLLSQDYILKQLIASLTHPDSESGKAYWQKTYQDASRALGACRVPLNTFNKVWITSGDVEVYEHDNIAVINQAALKAVLEEDLMALEKNIEAEGRGTKRGNYADKGIGVNPRINPRESASNVRVNKLASDVMREMVLPKINDDVNNGKNFATLRQIYHSLILAKWFKEKFKESFYKHYINQKNTRPIDINDPQAKEKIYSLYTQALRSGVYNVIRKDIDPVSHKQVRRRYFSGGMANLVSSGVLPVKPVGRHQVMEPVAPGRVHQMSVGLGDGTLSAAAASAVSAGGNLDSYAAQDRQFVDGYNALYNDDIDRVVRPARKFPFSEKLTIPYAKDNRVFRTPEGRRNTRQYAREVLRDVEAHVRTVIFGKTFERGEQVDKRSQTDANMGWTDMIREEEPAGMAYLFAQVRLTQVGIPAMMAGDYKTYTQCVIDYTQSRTNTSKRWLALVLQARKGGKGLPRWVYQRYQIMQDNPGEYHTFTKLFEKFDEYEASGGQKGLNPATYNLYAPAKIGEAIEAARLFSIKTGKLVAVFPVGAGGFGTPCAVVGETPEAVDEFLAQRPEVRELVKQGQAQRGQGEVMSDDEAEQLVGGTGKYGTGVHNLAFWVDAKADVDGVKIGALEGWNEDTVDNPLRTRGLKLATPKGLPWVLVNKNTLQEIELKDDETVDDNQYGDEWVVAKKWELGFDWQKHFRVDKSLLSNIEFVRRRRHTNGFGRMWPGLVKWARAHNKKIIISVPARWIDTLGSSWDLKDFRLSGTPEGNLKLEMLPSCNAVPSEYRLEIEVETIEDGNAIEYVAEQYFQGVHRVNPNKMIQDVDSQEDVPGDWDGLVFMKHPDHKQRERGIRLLGDRANVKYKERNVPALFARLFGIKGGLRFTCSKMPFVPRQGGMESSNAFTNAVAMIMNILSGADFSVAEVSHISTLAQINECNNITGNQGGDAADAGAGLHIYKGGMYDMEAMRDFSAFKVHSETGELTYTALRYQRAHPVFDPQPYTVSPSQQRHLDEPLREKLQEAVRGLGAIPETIIVLPFQEGQTAHYGLGRGQIYLSRKFLAEKSIDEVRVRIARILKERRMIRKELDDLGLVGRLDATAENPRERETILVDDPADNSETIALADLVDMTARRVHDELNAAASAVAQKPGAISSPAQSRKRKTDPYQALAHIPSDNKDILWALRRIKFLGDELRGDYLATTLRPDRVFAAGDLYGILSINRRDDVIARLGAPRNRQEARREEQGIIITPDSSVTYKDGTSPTALGIARLQEWLEQNRDKLPDDIVIEPVDGGWRFNPRRRIYFSPDEEEAMSFLRNSPFSRLTEEADFQTLRYLFDDITSRPANYASLGYAQKKLYDADTNRQSDGIQQQREIAYFHLFSAILYDNQDRFDRNWLSLFNLNGTYARVKEVARQADMLSDEELRQQINQLDPKGEVALIAQRMRSAARFYRLVELASDFLSARIPAKTEGTVIRLRGSHPAEPKTQAALAMASLRAKLAEYGITAEFSPGFTRLKIGDKAAAAKMAKTEIARIFKEEIDRGNFAAILENAVGGNPARDVKAVASSTLSSPGGIKMSDIKVASSPASRKIEFAAIGPEFFERLQFTILSIKKLGSPAEFAAVP